MPLTGHLRELRRRLTIGVLAIVVGTVVGWIIYPAAFDFLKRISQHENRRLFDVAEAIVVQRDSNARPFEPSGPS